MTYRKIDKPTRPGHYWYKFRTFWHVLCVEMPPNHRILKVWDERDQDWLRVSCFDGQWYGPPIPEPE